jgi:hypothetical protein
MSRYWRARSRSSQIVTALCVAAGFGIEHYFDLNGPSFLLIGVLTLAIAFFVGHYLPEFVLDLLMKVRTFRKHLFGTGWVEGHWLTLTSSDGGPARPGIVQIQYARDYTELNIVGWQRGDEVISSHSTYAAIDDNLNFVNYFRTTEPRPRTGIAVGQLFCSPGSYPNEYHGHRFYFSDGKRTETYQRAIKLNSKQVKRWKKQLGEHWISAVLLDASENLVTNFPPFKSDGSKAPAVGTPA